MGKKDKLQHKGKGNKNQQPSRNPPKNKKIKQERNQKDQAQLAKPKNASSLFKIIPEFDQEDGFAALGYDHSEQVPELVQADEGPEHYGGEEQSESYKVHKEEEERQIEEADVQSQQEEIEEEGDQQQEVFDNEQQGKDEIGQEQDEDVDADAPPLEGQQDKQPVDISVMSLQIQQTINILSNIGRLGDGKPRKHYILQLKQLFHTYYGYNFELIDHFLTFMNPAELVQLFEANQTQRPLTIRTNTLKTRRKQLAQNLIQRGVNLDPLAEWSKVGIKIYESKVPIGATPQYLAGHYMLQSASSLLPVIALDPQPGERILDMASAPGGKTTYIAQLMKNTGSIFANDLKKQRLKALQYNLYRLGVTNTVVTCRDGRKYPKIFPSSFDRVLLDAPCTGLGIISKDPSIKANRLQIDIYKNSHIQKELLLAAIDCARIGGVIVYSTCSVSPTENEEVVNFALKRRFIKVVDIQNDIGQEGLIKFGQKRYHPDLSKTKRIYPHVHNMDGFYLAKLVKTNKGKRQCEEQEEPNIA